jgi:hypothetical protein
MMVVACNPDDVNRFNIRNLMEWIKDNPSKEALKALDYLL